MEERFHASRSDRCVVASAILVLLLTEIAGAQLLAATMIGGASAVASTSVSVTIPAVAGFDVAPLDQGNEMRTSRVAVRLFRSSGDPILVRVASAPQTNVFLAAPLGPSAAELLMIPPPHENGWHQFETREAARPWRLASGTARPAKVVYELWNF